MNSVSIIAIRYGLDLELELRKKEEDMEEENNLMDWIEDVTGTPSYPSLSPVTLLLTFHPCPRPHHNHFDSCHTGFQTFTLTHCAT